MEQSQSGLKLRISRMFRSSFGLCRTRNVPDVIEKAVKPPETKTCHRRSFHFPVADQTTSMSPKPRTFPAICKPRCPEFTGSTVNNSCIRASKDALRRRKICVSGESGRKCPPESPFDDIYDFYGKKKSKKKKKNRSKPRSRRSGNSIKLEAFPFGSASNDSYSVRNSWWFSSDEDETDALFSSRSLSSDSSESLGRRKIGASGRSTVGDSLAVVKRSSDPYSDFRTSMVEMIIEKQIFGTKDLEELLQCFLSLNSIHHHNMILEVFTEIWEALFCDWT